VRTASSSAPPTNRSHGLLTFAVHVAVAAGEAPVEVVGADGRHVAVARAVEQHALLDVQRALHLPQLGLLPGGGRGGGAGPRHKGLQRWPIDGKC